MDAKLTDLLTKQDLADHEDRLLKRIIEEIGSKDGSQTNWLRSKDLQEMLGISSSGLQNLRIKRVIPFTKLEGVILYPKDEINKILENKLLKVNHQK